jgi:diphthine synthase
VRVRALREIVFVGLGLHNEMGISLRGLEEMKTADNVFIELYTNLMPDFSKENLEKISGKELQIVSREDLEERSGELILEMAETGKIVLLVPGDPLVATTHVALRIHAEKLGIKTRVVHGASILSAVIGLSGLHNYKFGKSVTIPLPSENPSETPYEVVAQNKRLGLHTLCLLDVKVEEDHYMEIHEGLELLLKVEEKRKEKIVLMNTFVVGIARAGSNNPTVKAGFLKDLLKYDFGDPPHSIIFPGKLHFMEAEALIVLAGAPDSLRGMVE